MGIVNTVVCVNNSKINCTLDLQYIFTQSGVYPSLEKIQIHSESQEFLDKQ